MLIPCHFFYQCCLSALLPAEKSWDGDQFPIHACYFRPSSFPNPLTALRTHVRLAKDSHCSAGYTAYSRTRALYLGAGNPIELLVGSDQSFRALGENRVWFPTPFSLPAYSCSHYADFDVQGFALDGECLQSYAKSASRNSLICVFFSAPFVPLTPTLGSFVSYDFGEWSRPLYSSSFFPRLCAEIKDLLSSAVGSLTIDTVLVLDIAPLS